MPATMKLDSKRDLFDIPDDIAYLNCGYMSPLMHSVVDAGVAGLRQKTHPWEIAPSDFFSGSDSLREAFATLVGAEAEDIAIVPAASYGISTAAANLPLERGQNVIVVAEQFPSNVYPWRERARDVGASLRTLERPEDDDWTRQVISSINDATAVVAVPHCHWTDGGLFDLEAIGALCRERGIGLAVDVTQSAGAAPLDVRAIRPDFLVAATYKWLMGPYSLGLMFVSKRWQEEGRPLEHNWIQRRNAENFSRLVDYEDAYAPGALRFDVGERSNFALVPAAEAGIQQLSSWGVPNVAETIAAMTERIADEASSLGLTSVAPSLRAGHYLGLSREGGFPDSILSELARRRVFVSVRGDSIRVTPHVYNDERDVERFFGALKAALR